MISAIRRKLLRWYDRHRRDLPWRRRASDSYAQWVAEVMLQQTRVETVLRYYEPFLTRFPTVRDLADADFDEVLKHWEGMGYYRRIHHLHEAVRVVCDQGGRIPDTADELRRLPGVGEYTAAAIASIAFGRREAAVDGNVARVLSRLIGVRDGGPSSSGRKGVWRWARKLIPPKRPGDFNQAWMDLGSQVCTPRSPDCARCPLRAHCRTVALGLPTPSAHRRRPTAGTLAVGVFVRQGRMLVQRRPRGGLWSGLWEFPTGTTPGPSRAASAVRDLARHLGLKLIGRLRDAGEVRHELTHRSLTFRVFATDVTPIERQRDFRWVTVEEFERLPVSTAYRKIFAHLRKSRHPAPPTRGGATGERQRAVASSVRQGIRSA